MSESLNIYLEENNQNLSKAKNIKKLKKLVDETIETEGWDEAIKKTTKFLIEKDYEDNLFKIVLGQFHQYNDLDIVFLVLVKYYIMDNETLKRLFRTLNISDLEIVLKKSIELSYNNNYHVLANRIISYYDKDLSADGYIDLIAYAKDFQSDTKVDSDSIIKFLTFKKSQLFYAPVPDWVSVEEGENLSLLLTLNPGKDYEDINSEVEKLVKKSKDFFYIGEEDKLEKDSVGQKINDALMCYLSSSSLIESKEISHKANRVFGPANRSIDKNCISNPGREGPCRMLECLCLELDEDAPYDFTLEEWFTGKCDNFDCSKKIRDRSHAVRIPIEQGGWKGCFCCFECMDKSILFRDKDMNFRIEAMKLALHDDGIMDRTKT